LDAQTPACPAKFAREDTPLDDLIQEFLVESNENLDRVDSALVKLEIGPSSAKLLAGVFRGVHSIKGASKIPRVVRDVSVACGKQVRIGTEKRTPSSTAPC
jgi:chemotaxis protein histidine kinase CheA